VLRVVAGVTGALALAFAGLVGAVAARRPAVLTGAAPDGVAGFAHVHTVRSHDGFGTLEGAALAAREAGARFLIVTEHNKRDPSPSPRWLDGVLIVHGIELSTPNGHLLALGAEPPPKRKSPRVLEEVQERGGLAAPAHPTNRKRPWVGPSTGFGAYEALSLDSDFRLALESPARWPLAVAALVGAPALVPALLPLERDGLAAYDRLAAERPLALLCGVDAHGQPPYAASFGG